MTESEQVIEAFDARARRREQRRDLFRMVLGTAAVGGAFAFASAADAQTVTDADVLNFALNLEYLEANFYAYATTGLPIPASSTTGTGTLGAATGGRAVAFGGDTVVQQYATEIAADELAHVNFLRAQLMSSAVAQPAIDLGISPTGAFSSAARAAGLIGATSATSPTFFDPYASASNFLLASFIFEDVGVTAYKGASPLISNKTYLEAAAGILAAEAYHASIIRGTLYARGVATPALRSSADAISAARDSLDGTTTLDQGISPTSGSSPAANITPADSSAIAFSRNTGQVLNIVYLNKAAVTAGGFFPNGVNGSIKTSQAN